MFPGGITETRVGAVCENQLLLGRQSTVMRTAFLFVFLLLFACSRDGAKKKLLESETPENVLREVLVSGSGILAPVKIQVDEGLITRAPVGEIIARPTDNHIRVAGNPVWQAAGKTRISTPGEDGFFLPSKKTIRPLRIPAGAPRIIHAKEMRSKDHNQANFRNMNKLQGLLNNQVNCLLEDHSGNLWIGTAGGMCRFDGQQFFHYTEKEGLSGNSVSSLLEDRSGNLWIGTVEGGVCRFDGSSFYRYSLQEGFISQTVSDILEDKKGLIWFATNDGVSCFNGKEFLNYSQTEGLSGNVVYSIAKDHNENLWFATLGAGACQFNGRSFLHFPEMDFVGSGTIYSLLEDKNGKMWFGTDGGGAVCLEGSRYKVYTQSDGLAGNTIKAMIQDRDGRIWFGTKTGLSNLSDTLFTSFSEDEGLTGVNITCLLENRSGNLWAGSSDGGVNRYFGNRFTHYTREEGLVSNSVRSIFSEPSGTSWFTQDGGFCSFDGEFFNHYNISTGLPGDVVLCSLKDRKGLFWFGTRYGITSFDGREFVHYDLRKDEDEPLTVLNMIQDREGNFWLATAGSGICHFNGREITFFNDREGLSESDVRCLAEDPDGNIWLGTKNGLKKISGNNISRIENIGNQPVNTLLCDKTGILWMGTDGGIYRLEGKRITQYTEKDGLISNSVLSILQDRKGNFWFGTRFGISRLREQKSGSVNRIKNTDAGSNAGRQFKNFSYEDGFLGIGCLSGALCEGPDGTIWAGTNDRLTAIHTDGLKEDRIPPDMDLNEISLFHEYVDWAAFLDKPDTVLTLQNSVQLSKVSFDSLSPWHRIPVNLQLPYNKNYINFHFSGIHTNQPGKVYYEFMLEGHDEDWISAGTRSEAPYTNLPPGKYRFRVRAGNDDGYWSQSDLIYDFQINPPWYKTLLFYILAGLLVTITLILLVKWRERNLIVQQKVLENKVSQATQVIRNQKEEVIRQKDLVEEQKKIVETKHRQLSDSIRYAERIQRSFLASGEMLASNLNDHFIFFLPKDVVSGDFYWAGRLNNGEFAILCADSTGHGVPGAIMSLLIILSVEKTIETLNQPGDILNETRRMIIDRLEKEQKDENSRDGMDCSFISFHPDGHYIRFAGAHNPLWVVKKGELTEYKADRMTVGRHERDAIPFSQYEIEVEKGDMIYAFSDGMPDQFGGPSDRKYGNARLKELLISASELPAEEQKKRVEEAFFEWKGQQDQVDDVIVMGIRV